MKQTTDKRFIQANREAVIAVLLGLGYFIWWYLTAYGFGDAPVSEYTYIWGFPAWFFYSCVAGFALFSILSALMVRFCFKEIFLARTDEDKGDKDA